MMAVRLWRLEEGGTSGWGMTGSKFHGVSLEDSSGKGATEDCSSREVTVSSYEIFVMTS